MKIAIGSDHRGLELKQKVIKLVTDAGNEYKDFGAYSEARVDYPNIAEAVGKAVVSGQYDRGILICGTGIGCALPPTRLRASEPGGCHDSWLSVRGSITMLTSSAWAAENDESQLAQMVKAS